MKRILLSKDWFVRRPNTAYTPVDLPHDGSISLPRDPAAPGGVDTGYFASTDLTYVKHLRIPAEAKHAILDIDGAYMCATVFLNQDQLCVHPHGYTPWLVDLSRGMHPGAVDKLRIDTAGLQPSTRWYSGSGLYRDVFLWLGGDIRIEPRATCVTTPEVSAERATIHVSTAISFDRPATVFLRATLLAPSGEEVGRSVCLSVDPSNSDDGKQRSVGFDLVVETPDLWDLGHGALYTLQLEVLEGDAVVDTDTVRFGIRSISFDVEHGFRLNGRTVKLRGGCIHHDNGVLGACAFPAAERRRARLLQETGFNAIRIAHNPPSLAMLEACDELGIILMDEAYDMWNRAKRAYDNHLWFADWWQRDIDAMVLRDRNHPCVTAYSIGNEICERSDNSDGPAWAKRLADEFRRMDPTRPVTAAFCTLWDYPLPEDVDPVECKDTGFPHWELSWEERNRDFFAPAMEAVAAELDIVGYNYVPDRYAADHKRYPKRIIWGSETFSRGFYQSWKNTMENAHVLGDFVWTSFDYLGEAGIGRHTWYDPKAGQRLDSSSYPWRIAYDADLDLCGYRRPQSWFREAIWLGNAEPRIWTTHPRFRGMGFAGTSWEWYDVHDTWTFPDVAPGTPIRCEVYTDADEVAFLLNDRLVGTAKPVEAIAALDVPYEPGRLVARTYRDGKFVAESALETVGEPARIVLEPETDAILADRRDLAYVRISLVDDEGRRVVASKAELYASVAGGELLGIFSADPCNDDQYTSPLCHAFHGRAVAIVRTATPGKVTVSISSPGLPAASCMVEAK